MGAIEVASRGSRVGGKGELAAEVRRRLGPAPTLPGWPLISLVVLNRDGADRLRQLLAGLCVHTDYPHLELILVDNASSDDSLDFIRSVEAPFPISILVNHHNESFSDACNQGAELANGELLLFLNNDAEPFEAGWLRELIACLRRSGAGAVGPTLIEPAEAAESVAPSGYVVHQRGLGVREGPAGFAPDYRDHLSDPLGDSLGEDVATVALVAACLLIDRELFETVGGFTHGYWYGPEDVDLALKLRERGHIAVCSGRSILIHPPSSTLSEVEPRQRSAWVSGNRRLFMERWGPRLRREYELDRLSRRGLWASSSDPQPAGSGRTALEALSFCLRSAAPDAPAADGLCQGELLAGLGDAFEAGGHRCVVLLGDEVDDLRGLECDVAIHLHGGVCRYVLRPAQLNVLLSVGGDATPLPPECGRYDLALVEGERTTRFAPLAKRISRAVEKRAAELGVRTRIGPNAATIGVGGG